MNRTLWDSMTPDEDGAEDGGESRRDRAGRHIWTVGALVDAARLALERSFPYVLVRGEVSDFHAHRSGHWYFDLKDERAVLRIAMFRNENARVRFEVEEGLEVVVGGRLNIFVDRGQFQLVASLLEPVGWGALQLAFEQLKGRLQQEGLFDAARKGPLPLLPSCVGVVTSSSGAAWRDLTRVWRRRQVPIHVVLAPARVQGRGAAEEIVAAIRALDRWGEADVVIVTRGGGSREDLWAFNEEKVARAIAVCATPVISAVGHETDTTIADLVADRRAATPTAAAEIVAASRNELLGRLVAAARQARSGLDRRFLAARGRLNEPALQRRLRRPSSLLDVYRQRLDDAWTRVTVPVERDIGRRRQRLDALARRLRRVSPLALALRRQNRLDSAVARIRSAARGRLHSQEARLAAAAARVEALSPLAVLARGYAICERAKDRLILRRPDQVEAGEEVRVLLHRGRLRCRVEDTYEVDTGDALRQGSAASAGRPE